MKRTLAITLVALGLLVLVPTTASASHTTGTFTGRTSFTGPITLKATNFRLYRLRVGVVFNCTDGDRFQTQLPNATSYFPAQNVVRINGVHRYSATFTGSRGASRYTHSGRISGTRAIGTFVGTRRYNTDDELDPQGTVICRTGTVRYNIPRVGRL
jgi:hypothetical protein